MVRRISARYGHEKEDGATASKLKPFPTFASDGSRAVRGNGGPEPI